MTHTPMSDFNSTNSKSHTNQPVLPHKTTRSGLNKQGSSNSHIPPPNSNTGMTRIECFYNYSNSGNHSLVEATKPGSDNAKLEARSRDKKLAPFGETLIKTGGYA